jgi:hypothetical protein
MLTVVLPGRSTRPQRRHFEVLYWRTPDQPLTFREAAFGSVSTRFAKRAKCHEAVVKDNKKVGDCRSGTLLSAARSVWK